MWTFEITTGRMYGPNGGMAGVGYAGGNLGKDPDAINNPADESIRNTGPLPEGFYSFGELVFYHPKLGRYVFPLIPEPANEMYGRSGFWCHGDTEPPGKASEGCIVQPYSTRVNMAQSFDRQLQVVAVLPETKQPVAG